MIFDSAEGNWSGEVDNIIVGTVQLVVSLIAAIVMDKFQRKHLMIVSATMQALSLALLSLYLILKDKGVDVEAFRWAPLICFLGFVSFYNIGVGPLWNTVVGELLPQSIKNTAMSFCGLLFGGLIFVFTITFQRIEKSIGLGQTLIFFAIMSLSTSVYVAIFIVETKGKTLEEIQLELNGKKLKPAPL
ncbi:hypothetical protein WA026_005975 [Henosepilachna vigintioctopunctata]|uniref:Major facilitator superfamily (MFS) profile domain-containing protein n=1 Tax=Henosepilachna vigintioctopunctata TaxID=420089 RepID=A0AAW1U3F4_9CUCU